jgi:hypothetical protein
MKILIFLSLLVLGVTACDNTKSADTAKMNSSTSETKMSVKTDTATHVQVFACPMHPEITGKEGDKCSKCGMALVHK